MDATFSTEDDEFRQEVRAFLRDATPRELKYKVDNGIEMQREDVLSWHRPESISESFTADLVELRELIEPVAAKLAADRATSDDLTRIEAAYLRMETSVDDYEGFYMADVDFHLAVLNASHNQLVQRLAGIIGTVLGLSFSLQKTVRIPLRESLESHYQVFDGIRQRNRRSAERAMRITIRRGRNTLSQQRKAVRDQAFQAP